MEYDGEDAVGDGGDFCAVDVVVDVPLGLVLGFEMRGRNDAHGHVAVKRREMEHYRVIEILKALKLAEA